MPAGRSVEYVSLPAGEHVTSAWIDRVGATQATAAGCSIPVPSPDADSDILDARARFASGRVAVRLELGPDNDFTNVSIYKSSGNPIVACRPIPSTFQYVVDFQLRRP